MWRGEEKALGSQTSGVTTEVATAAVSAIPLESQNRLLPPAPAGVPKVQPAEDPQHKGCSVMSVTNPKSHLCSESGAATPTPTAAWDGQVRSAPAAWDGQLRSAPADTRENQQLLHRKTDSI